MNEDLYVSPNVWKIYAVSYLHFNIIGTLIGIAVGLAVSILFPMEQNIDAKLLSPFVRKFLNPKYTMNSNETYTNNKLISAVHEKRSKAVTLVSETSEF